MDKNDYIRILKKYQKLGLELNELIKDLDNTSSIVKTAIDDGSNKEEKELLNIHDLLLSEYNKIIYNLIPEIQEKIETFNEQAPGTDEPVPEQPEEPSRPNPPPGRNQNKTLN